MASIRKEVFISADPAVVWDALRDVGALHTRLCPGFVTNTVLEEGARLVTFGNGMVARELIVDVNDADRRLAWSIVGGAGGQMTHHNGVAQVFPEANGTRFVWLADLLPHDLAPRVAMMMEQGLAAIERTLGKPKHE
jgi:carbon monoxide dehydrogenase subunit G